MAEGKLWNPDVEGIVAEHPYGVSPQTSVVESFLVRHASMRWRPLWFQRPNSPGQITVIAGMFHSRLMPREGLAVSSAWSAQGCSKGTGGTAALEEPVRAEVGVRVW